MQISHILVPTDFSRHARVALDYAVTLAQHLGARVTLLHVIHSDLDYAFPPLYTEVTGEILDRLSEEAQRELERTAHSAADDHVELATEIRHGTPFVEVVKAARDLDCDLIVIATHGRTGIAHALIGSVAERVVRKAPCPVLSVKPEEHELVLA